MELGVSAWLWRKIWEHLIIGFVHYFLSFAIRIILSSHLHPLTIGKVIVFSFATMDIRLCGDVVCSIL